MKWNASRGKTHAQRGKRHAPSKDVVGAAIAHQVPYRLETKR